MLEDANYIVLSFADDRNSFVSGYADEWYHVGFDEADRFNSREEAEWFASQFEPGKFFMEMVSVKILRDQAIQL